LVGDDVCFPRRRRTAAGTPQWLGGLRLTTHTSFLCGVQQGKGIRVGVGEREEVLEQREECGLTNGVVIDKVSAAVLQAPAMNFVGLAASRVGVRKGDGEEITGYL
jgi:hypothetical protein